MEIKFSLKFFREYFHIPRKVRLQWCLIEYLIDGKSVFNLGVKLGNADKVIDVAKRQFVQQRYAPVYCNVFAAQRKSGPTAYVFVNSLGKKLTLPKSYVKDVYFRSIYSQELLKADLC